MININECEKKLYAGLTAMDITLSPEKITRLMDYLVAFDKWNKAYNLSAVRDPLEMIERHLLDSLALLPYLESYLQECNNASKERLRIIDVGTGGGLPGIPLAIACPEVDMVLLDSNGKKTRFLFQARLILGADNIVIENTRVENYQPEKAFDVVVSRAFASLHDMVTGTAHLLAEQGRFWAMKGLYPENELRDCKKHAIVESTHHLSIPGSEGERHLLVLAPVEK